MDFSKLDFRLLAVLRGYLSVTLRHLVDGIFCSSSNKFILKGRITSEEWNIAFQNPCKRWTVRPHSSGKKAH